MKCLSLHQPWASLLVHGKKRVETRGWAISHRGPLLIHAAKRFPTEMKPLCKSEPFYSALVAMGYAHDHGFTGMPLGAIVGRIDVAECYPTKFVRTVETGPTGRTEGGLLIGPVEHAFGDYGPGRFAFFCSNFVAFEKPVPFTGRQGLFDVPDDVLAQKGGA